MIVFQNRRRESEGGATPAPLRGFTLVELLIAIAILGIIAGLILGVAAVAQETAREAQTRSTILRIHTLLVDHFDTYRNRRVSLSDGVENLINTRSGQLRGQLIAEARLHALREIMLTELPDRWSDVLLGPVPANPRDLPDPNNDNRDDPVGFPIYADVPDVTFRTSLGTMMFREYQRVVASENTNTGALNTRDQVLQNQSAECLFMVVMMATGDGEAPGLFGEGVIGDTDGDGAREFLDGWGNPIRFLRWAPGAETPVQLCLPRLRQIALDARRFNPGATDDQVNAEIAAEVNENRDPFDLFRIQQYTTTDATRITDNDDSNDVDGAFGFYILPYVYSTGGDEESGVVDAEATPEYVAWRPPTNLTAASISLNDERRYRFVVPIDPYTRLVDVSNAPSFTVGVPSAILTSNPNRQMGSTLNDAVTDNITNHLITARASK